MLKRDALQGALSDFLGDALPVRATRHINDALQLADLLKERGFIFRLRDARPKDPGVQCWKAAFYKDEWSFEYEDPDAALAVCQAALGALERCFKTTGETS